MQGLEEEEKMSRINLCSFFEGYKKMPMFTKGRHHNINYSKTPVIFFL